MFATVVIAILLLIGIVMLLVGKISGSTGGYSLRPWASIPFVIAFVVLGLSATYTQDPGEAVVLKSFGGKVSESVDTTSGLGWKMPWDTAIKFETRNQRIEMFTNPGGDGADGAAINAPTGNGSPATVSITVRYSLIPSEVSNLYKTYRGNTQLKDTALKPGIRTQTRIATAKYDPFAIKQRRSELAQDIRERLEVEWEGLGVIIDEIDLGDLTLDPSTEDAIIRINENQAKVEQARAALLEAQVQAETTKTDAQAQADADQIIRCGATTRQETREVAGIEQVVAVVVPKEGDECENRINEQVLLRNLIEVYEKLAGTGQLIIKDGSTLLQLPAVGTQQGG